MSEKWPEVPPEAVVYSGDLPDWVQKEINRVCEEREERRKTEQRRAVRWFIVLVLVSWAIIRTLVWLGGQQ